MTIVVHVATISQLNRTQMALFLYLSAKLNKMLLLRNIIPKSSNK